MKRRVSIRPQADRDLDEAADFIARHSISAARRFYDSAAQTFLFLSDNPEMGGPCELDVPELAGSGYGLYVGSKNTWFSIVAFRKVST
jgi:plasmid stabilization system protein ParE